MSETKYAIQPSESNSQYMICEVNAPFTNQLDLIFNTKDDATLFAVKNGYKLCSFKDGVPSSLKKVTKRNIKNSLFEGDCLKVLKKMPDNTFDMILCDLPYGTTQNKWDSVINLSKLWEQYHRVVKTNGAIVLTSQGVFTAKLILSNEQNFKYKITWEKSKSTNFLNAKKQPLRKHEDICVFYKKQPTYNPQMSMGEPYDKGVRKDQLSGSYGDFNPRHVKSDGERYPTDVIYFKTAESEGKVWHPTQKPISLARYLIRTYSNPGDLILDNAFGSGSFLVAAALEGRDFCGIEKNEDVHLFKKDAVDYIAVAEKRIEDASKETQLKVHREPELIK